MAVRMSFECQVLLSPDWAEPLSNQAFSPYILACSVKIRRFLEVVETIDVLQPMRSHAVHPKGVSSTKVLRVSLCGPCCKAIIALFFGVDIE
jgi:hypothetical protein